MCDRSLYVGSLLNLPSVSSSSGDSYYFPTRRAAANGGHHQLGSSLPALPYPRSSLAWSCASPCPAQSAVQAFTSPPQSPSYLSPASVSLPLTLSCSNSKASSSDGHHKYYTPDGVSKQDPRGRQSRESKDLGGMSKAAPKGAPRSVQGAPATLLDVDSCFSTFKGDLKQAINLNLTLPSAAAAQPGLRASLKDGMPPIYASTPL